MTRQDFSNGARLMASMFPGKFAPTEKQEYLWWDMLQNLEPEVYSEAVHMLISRTEKWWGDENFGAIILGLAEEARGRYWARQNEFKSSRKAFPLPEEKQRRINGEGLKMLAAKLGIKPSQIVKKF